MKYSYSSVVVGHDLTEIGALLLCELLLQLVCVDGAILQWLLERRDLLRQKDHRGVHVQWRVLWSWSWCCWKGCVDWLGLSLLWRLGFLRQTFKLLLELFEKLQVVLPAEFVQRVVGVDLRNDGRCALHLLRQAHLVSGVVGHPDLLALSFELLRLVHHG